MWQSIALFAFYFVVFLLLIYRLNFFKQSGLRFQTIVALFLLKLLAGFVLILIYSRFYTVRNTTDAFKYYDDAKVIYQALFTDPIAYLRITFGLNSGAADLFPYYQKMNNWFLSDDYTLYNDSRSVIRFNALVFPFSHNHYSIHILFMCFISLCGLLALYQSFEKHFRTRKIAYLSAIFLVPSVLFWGSGVLKEGLILFAGGFLIYYFCALLRKEAGIRAYLGFALFFFFMWGIKVHVLFALIPGFIILFWQAKFPSLHLYTKTAIVAIGGVVCALAIASISEKYSPFRMLAQKQKDFINIANGGFYFEQLGQEKDTFYVQERHRNLIQLAPDSSYWQLSQQVPAFRWSKGNIVDTLFIDGLSSNRFRFIMHLDSSGSQITIRKLEPNLLSALCGIPQALINTLFRPTFFESKNYLSLFAALENLLLIVCILICVLHLKAPAEAERELFIFCISFVFILFAIAGLTTPVLGALVRYKIPALPYLFLALILFCDENKLSRRFPRIAKYLSGIKL